jgi:hypothetical protein
MIRIQTINNRKNTVYDQAKNKSNHNHPRKPEGIPGDGQTLRFMPHFDTVVKS